MRFDKNGMPEIYTGIPTISEEDLAVLLGEEDRLEYMYSTDIVTNDITQVFDFLIGMNYLPDTFRLLDGEAVFVNEKADVATVRQDKDGKYILRVRNVKPICKDIRTNEKRKEYRVNLGGKMIPVARLVCEVYYRGVFGEGREIHHINGDHLDNRPDNLIVIKRRDHRKLHRKNLSEVNKSVLLHKLMREIIDEGEYWYDTVYEFYFEFPDLFTQAFIMDFHNYKNEGIVRYLRNGVVWEDYIGG